MRCPAAKTGSTTRRSGVGVAVMLVAGLLTACATPSTELYPTPPSFRVAVLDFRVPATWRDPEAPDRIDKELKGWWFSSRGVWHNPGMGRVAGDIFHHEINLLPFVNCVSRIDIKYYLAEKRELIRKALDEKMETLEEQGSPTALEQAQAIDRMTDADLEAMVEQLPPREVGLELKVDRVLVGRIHDAYLAHNRTIHWYWNYVDLEVELVDVDTGNVVWRKRSQFKKNFASTPFLLEHAAKQMIDAMKYEYLYQPR